MLANVKARGMKPGIGTERHVDFESQVRSQINTRDGNGGPETGRGVLGKATLRDETGGRYMLRFLAWPDGAHLYEIALSVATGDERGRVATDTGREVGAARGGDARARAVGALGSPGPPPRRPSVREAATSSSRTWTAPGADRARSLHVPSTHTSSRIRKSRPYERGIRIRPRPWSIRT